jgi:hypothetical protein
LLKVIVANFTSGGALLLAREQRSNHLFASFFARYKFGVNAICSGEKKESL